MVDLYKKYYLDSETIKEILQNGIVVFDTSALLDLYYYSSETRNEIFNKAFNYLKGRLWIPAQVYFEYLKNKSKVSEKPILSYERLLTKQSKDGGYVNSIVDKTKMLQGQSLGEIKNQLKTLKEQTLGTDKHPYLSPDVYAEYESVLSVVENQLTDFSTKTADFQTRIQKEIEKKIAELQSDLLPDNVNNAIESSFQIGKEYSFSKMMEIAREGSFRYSEEIPPGYEDGKEKTGLQKYGDLFVWNQILDCAKSTPQAYRFDLLDRKYHEAFEKEIGIYGSSYTNTMMVELGERLYFAAGSDKNIKLTTKDDLELFKAYLKADKDSWLK